MNQLNSNTSSSLPCQLSHHHPLHKNPNSLILVAVPPPSPSYAAARLPPNPNLRHKAAIMSILTPPNPISTTSTSPPVASLHGHHHKNHKSSSSSTITANPALTPPNSSIATILTTNPQQAASTTTCTRPHHENHFVVVVVASSTATRSSYSPSITRKPQADLQKTKIRPHPKCCRYCRLRTSSSTSRNSNRANRLQMNPLLFGKIWFNLIYVPRCYEMPLHHATRKHI
ncbi:hypothetical protein LR48_Vigan10g259200 [Vigna angularis]|uniref:Uncharacterized protein n=1 Tax=Phaseolus angularis TaxID=3914 RepID=A0A0L9VNR7_PHAAN|nr:hypothetical protein LR48_Vigan10g259200 [Vigna angularis]